VASVLPDSETFCRVANAWVAQLLRREIARAGRAGLLHDSPLEEPPPRCRPRPTIPRRAPIRPTNQAAAAAAARTLQERLDATRQAGQTLPFLRLCGELELDPLEAALLLIGIAVATEPRVRRLLGRLQTDVDNARINVGLALGLLASDANLPWQLLEPEGRLRAYHLVSVTGGSSAYSLTSRFLSVPDPVVAYATRGRLWLDERLGVVAAAHDPDAGWDDLVWPAEDKRLLRRRLKLAAERAGEPVAVLLRGSVGSGRKAIASAVCRELHQRLLVVDAENLPGDEEGALATFRVAIRDARLHQALLYLENADALRRDTPQGAARLRAVRALLPLYGRLLFLASERSDRIDAEDSLDVNAIDVPALGAAERAALWRRVVPASLDPGGALVDHLVARFPVNPGDILGVRGDVAALARLSGGLLDRRDVVRLVLDRSRHNLRALAHEVVVEHDLEDVILPPQVLERCQQIVELVERYRLLRETWGLGTKVLPHRGVSALFSGPPGTGKSLMAGVLGRQLGLDVYRIDTALIVSKWVGETEKNLGRLFAEAQRTRAVLVFDEADALFARRTAVMTSVDRHGNAQVNYLLSQMESFDGVIILTTNLESAIDEAFVRRIQFHVRFPSRAPRSARPSGGA
jgi:AAA+ superfamily predicted ATPase